MLLLKSNKIINSKVAQNNIKCIYSQNGVYLNFTSQDFTLLYWQQNIEMKKDIACVVNLDIHLRSRKILTSNERVNLHVVN